MSEEKEIDSYHTEELICPYCGFERVDELWEIDSEATRYECDKCGKDFQFEQETTRTFTTYPTCQPGDEHQFNEWHHYLNERWTRYCKICSAREWKKV